MKESLWPWGNGFNDPSRRNHKDTLGSEFCHSNKETMMVRAQGRVSGAGRVDKGLPSIQTPLTCPSHSQMLRNLDSKRNGPQRIHEVQFILFTEGETGAQRRQ